jgi:magnesium transporter
VNAQSAGQRLAERLRLLAPVEAIRALESAHAADAAEALRGIDVNVAQLLFRGLDSEAAARVLEEFPPELQEMFLASVPVDAATDLVERMASDDAADLLQGLPAERAEALLDGMDRVEAARIAAVLRWPDGTAGALMATETIAVREDQTIAETIEAIRRQRPASDSAYYVYVVDADGRLTGVLSLRDLVTAPPGAANRTIVRRDVHAVEALTDQEEVARRFGKYSLLAMPVTDEDGRLLGVVTVDDVVDVVREEADEDAYRLAGSSPEAEHAPPLRRALIRLPWILLGISIEIVAAKSLSLFAGSLERLLTLAYFLPVLNSMAGNFGIQTVATLVRAFASGEIDTGDFRRAVRREIGMALVVAAASAAVVGLVVVAWERSAALAIVTGGAMLLALVAAAGLSVGVPFALVRLGGDPAVASGPVVTTSLDVLTGLLYLSLATAALLR